MEQEIQDAFHDSVGAIMQYLDDAEATSLLKRAIRTELWELCDKKIKPLAREFGNGTIENFGNR